MKNKKVIPLKRKKRITFRTSKDTTLAGADAMAAELVTQNGIDKFSIKLGMSPGFTNDKGEYVGSDMENETVTVIIGEI